MLIEISMLKHYPCSNLNRGEDGSPKSSMLGSTVRGNISAQSLKRIWRDGKCQIFKGMVKGLGETMGTRTRQLPSLVADRMLAEGYPAELVAVIKNLLTGFGKAKDSEKSEKDEAASQETADDGKKASAMPQLIFLGENDIVAIEAAVKECLAKTMHPELNENGGEKKDDEKRPTKKQRKAELAKAEEDLAKAVESQLNDITKMPAADLKALVKRAGKIKVAEVEEAAGGSETRSLPLDIAMFGRMTTSDCMRDVESAVHVARAFSTNENEPEIDLVAGLDDALRGKTMADKGAALLANVEFNSNCYYIYANIDTDILRENLKYNDNTDELIHAAVKALIEAMAFENPTAMQTNFSSAVLPSAMMIECKDRKIPVTMSSAYTTAVDSSDIVEESIRRLAREADMLNREFELEVPQRFWYTTEKYRHIEPECATKVCNSFKELVSSVDEVLR